MFFSQCPIENCRKFLEMCNLFDLQFDIFFTPVFPQCYIFNASHIQYHSCKVEKVKNRSMLWTRLKWHT